jgi:hypothetical protein
MGSFSDYTENKVLDHVTGKTAFTKPTAYIALFTAAPSDAGGGTEVSGGSYARVATTGTDWNAASGGSTSNAAAITFPTATGSWGTVTHFALMDASTAGNQLAWGALTTSKAFTTDDTAQFAAGTLTLSLD